MGMKVAIIGAKGRMGQAMAAGVTATDDLELVAQLDVGDDITAETLNGAEVAIEFTKPYASLANVLAIIDAGVNPVVGTTGWTDEALAQVEEELATKPELGAVIAPNYALSAVLAMTFAQKAARYFDSAEVIELHHPNKVDAPSGTALTTAKHIAEARREAGLGAMPDATETDPDGARGANIDGVHVHAVRLKGLTAHEEIVFGNAGEQLTIRTDSFDRESFWPGVLLAVREVKNHPGLTFGLDKLMDL
ncbi:MAG: 4-hydroxy-tetrahydrodipicolinate reductase [Flaviflexus sp.]|uniref:4-hydroxy-tetrahydrodipicolinate reductase n=1 Tax=Flaviflexus sp. TaxID=1969482 RepID=UPI00352C6726